MALQLGSGPALAAALAMTEHVTSKKQDFLPLNTIL